MRTNQTPVQPNDTTDRFPFPALYTFAGRSEPVVVLGLAPASELRIVDAQGHFRTVGEHRVRVPRAAA